MKKGTKAIIIAACILGVAALAAIPAVLLFGNFGQEKFGSIVESELFQDLPLMTGKDVTYTTPEDVGGNNELLWVHNSTTEEYQAYLALLEKNQYVKYSDNGENGIDGYLYMTNLQKDGLLVSVAHYPLKNDTSIELCQDAALSPNLIDNPDLSKNDIAGAKTKFIQPELYSAGNSFIFQLKNGHFLINDGGNDQNGAELPAF